MERTAYKFYEFFAGGGMARAGLGNEWECLFANDFDAKKGAIYKQNWPGNAMKLGDIRAIKTSDLPEQADLVWASFPCQDLSLAGVGAGLQGERSGTFWPFWELTKSLVREKRAPAMVVLENVSGALTSHDGKDFASIAKALNQGGYRFGAVLMDAALFLPQSRPRLFILAIHESVALPETLLASGPTGLWHPNSLQTAFKKLDSAEQENWIWWALPAPQGRKKKLADLIEDHPSSVRWHEPEETARLLAMMSVLNQSKVEEAKCYGRKMIGTVYKRTRRDKSGNKVQRAEVRFDGVAGCLRTPAGGSSRQLILVVEGDQVRSRLISSRETARLMGLPERYKLPKNYNEAYHLTGDGVVVPVVRHLAKHIFEPILTQKKGASRCAA